MPNWKLDTETTSVVWDEDAPDPVDDEGIAGIDLGGTYATDDGGEFDPGTHNIDEVKAYIADNPDEVQRVYDAEVAGKGRSSLLDWLTAD